MINLPKQREIFRLNHLFWLNLVLVFCPCLCCTLRCILCKFQQQKFMHLCAWHDRQSNYNNEIILECQFCGTPSTGCPKKRKPLNSTNAKTECLKTIKYLGTVRFCPGEFKNLCITVKYDSYVNFFALVGSA